MDAPVRVVVETAAAVLGPDRRLGLPHRQRPYAWGIEHVQRLVNDLIAVASGPVEQRSVVLGRVLLVNAADGEPAMIVDGHQRLVTLTILISVLRDLENDVAARARLGTLVGEGGRYRLTPQASLARVLARYVQEPGGTAREVDEDPSSLSETESGVLANRDFVRGRLMRADVTDDVRRRLGALLVANCWLIVQTMNEEDAAWKLLSDEESTGLDFSHTDRAKTTILSDLPLAQRDACTAMWEGWHHEFGSEDTLALLQHTRTLLLRKRSERPIEIDICKRLMSDGRGDLFFRNELEPRARVLRALRQRTIGRGAAQASITRSLTCLTWMDPQIWVPAAMHWQDTRGDDDGQSALFYARLDRLVWLQRISGAQPAVRETRILDVIEDIDQEGDVDRFASLVIERELRAAAVAALREKGFFNRRFSTVVLRRLTLLGGDTLETAGREDLTIEHVLPRRPLPGSQWLRDFTNRPRVRSYADRLGNLTLLTKLENNQIGAEDFPIKRPVLAASQMALAREVTGAEEWTPHTVNERTEMLIGRLLADWDLPTA